MSPAKLLPGRPPRILHLVPVDGVGGVEVAAKSMLDREDLACAFRLQFIETKPPGGRSLLSVGRICADNWRAFGSARAFDPDVIICSLWRSVPIALLLRALCPRAKLVYFVHLSSTVHGFDAALSRVAMKASDQIWGDSLATLQARGVPQARGRVISFVTKRVEVPGKSFVGPRFVSWGRLHRQKGFDRAIRLIASLSERGVDATYDIFGPDGGERDALVALVRELGMEDRIRLPGELAHDNLPSLASGYAFFLQLSRSEGMCMAAVEAMQLGLVPIATRVGEMMHYVTPQTGVALDPDEPERATREIEGLIKDPDQWTMRSLASMRYWREAPLYADDVCQAATELLR